VVVNNVNETIIVELKSIYKNIVINKAGQG